MAEYDGVPGDRGMELEEHLIELGRRFLWVFAIVAVITLAAYPISGKLIAQMKADFVPPNINIIALNPVEVVFTQIKIAITLSLIVGAPLIVYETFAFMRPGLYPSERRFYVGIVPASLVLFLLGGAISYRFLIGPLSKALIGASTSTTTPLLVLSRFIDFVSFMLVTVGTIFQVPLVIHLLVKMELVEPTFLREKRRIIYALMFGVVTIFNPDPTMATPLVITAGFILLYEVSIRLFAREKKTDVTWNEKEKDT